MTRSILLAAAWLPLAVLLVPVPEVPLPPARRAFAVQGTPCPRPVAVEAGESPFEWRADPDLVDVARALARHRSAMAPLPGIGPVQEALAPLRGRPTVWVLERLGCLEELGLAGVQPDWVAGVASARGNFLAVRADRTAGDLPGLPAVFRHEVAHLALAAATDGGAPRWLQEGYAQYAAGSWDWQDAWRLRAVFFSRGGELLRSISLDFPRDPAGARLAYQLSYTAAHELASIAGTDGLAAYFAALRDGATADQAMRSVFGLTLGQFEERWKKRVASRYGILYVLSRATLFWIAVTLLLLWVGRRRKRRDRRRLAELKEAERREEEARSRLRVLPGGWEGGREPDPGEGERPAGGEPPSR